MWSTSNGTRNRISPVQNLKLEGNKKNTHSSDWDDDSVKSPKSNKSTSGIPADIEKHGKVPPTTYSLDKLIRKRKYDVLDSQVGHLFNKDETTKRRTASLTARLKNKLFEKPVKPVKGCDAWKYRQKQSWRKFKISLKEVGYKIELWRSWFKRIEGHQGTGVLSYFVFLKWLFFLNIYLFLLIFVFVVLPNIAFSSQGYTTAVTNAGVSVSTTNTITCSDLYSNNVTTSSAAEDLIQDFIQGTGWMEKTALFYGWYDAVELEVNSSHSYMMPFAYFMTAMGVLFLSLVRMARFTIASFKENLHDNKENVKTDYCNKVFGGWDYALDDAITCHAKTKSIYKEIVANLDYQRFLLTRAERGGCDTCKVYTIRFFINFIILAILGGAGYLIYWVNDWSTSYLVGESSSGSLTVLIVEFLPSLTITILNVIVPLFFGLLVKLEDYTEDVVIKLTLIRTVFLRLASLAVLMVSLYVNITCTDKDTTCNVGQGSCTTIRCWETYVGQAFYKLVAMDFFVHIVVIFCYELPRKLCTTKCSCKFCGKIGPAEFDVSKSVLDLVYTQALCWIGFLYCPLITGCSLISSFTQFYLKLFSALYTTVPPEKPYKASKSNNFFMMVLMATFFLCCFPVGYSMVKITPSKGCGPFRIYTEMSVTVDVTINNLPSWLESIVRIFTSTALIITLITVLCLTVYYLHVRGKAHNARAEGMKEQLVMEGKDKQFLLAKIYEITGEGPKPKSKPKPRPPPPTVKTVNEIPSEEDTKQFIDNDVPPPPPYNDEIVPVVAEISSIEEETKPETKDIKPVAEDTKPVVEETKPVMEETKPVVEETKPVVEETKPEVAEIQPIVENDDWDDKPIELVVLSPPSKPLPKPDLPKPSPKRVSSKSAKKTKKSNLKSTSKVTPRTEDNSNSHMPFDF